jgi:hypothetical protein
MNNKVPDAILIVLALLLLVSIAAFVFDLIPYPFGILILSLFMIARFSWLKNSE